MMLKRLSSLIVGVALLIAGVGIGASSSDAFPVEQIASSLERYEDRLKALVAAIGEVQQAESDHSQADADQFVARQILEDAERTLEEDRSRFSAVAVHAYMGRGGSVESFATDSLRILAMSSSRLRSDERAVLEAEKKFSQSSKAARETEALMQQRQRRVVQLEGPAAEALEDMDSLISQKVPTLPAAAYWAYIRASARAEELDSRCRVAPALLVGIGRIMSNHGRTPDSTLTAAGTTDSVLRGLVGSSTNDSDGGTIDGSAEKDVRVGPLQLTVLQWNEFAMHDDPIIDSPEWLLSQAIATARLLCSFRDDLGSIGGVRRSLNHLTGNSALTEAILGSARQSARSDDLGLGSVPTDPIQTAAMTLLLETPPDSSLMSSIDYVLAWARLRLGTPYSQCQGLDLRPDDPVCPPGTNRFGSGFFDCSGFVSAAYAAVGIALPTTTDAMAIDADFGSSKISDEFDPDLDQPGDVLLMDGHVALSAGNSVIIHTSGGQLTEEPLPTWVRNGVLGVYRPLRAN